MRGIIKLTFKSLLCMGLCVSLIFFMMMFSYGLRVPGFQFDNYHPVTVYEIKKEEFYIMVEGGFIKQTGTQIVARANSPHFEIRLSGNLIGLPVVIENIHPGATLQSSNPYLTINEEVTNLTRNLTVHGHTHEPSTVKWVFPEKKHYRFMALGDTGAGGELEWALIRAKQLNADFIMHLGDMFYSHQDVHSSFITINNSQIPVYNIYGNHDYYNNGEYPDKNTFNKVFSPSNFQFSLLGKNFVSLDTSSHIFPFNKGKRGAFLKKLTDTVYDSENETLLFTHQPIANSMIENTPELEHGITGFEGAWLEQKLLSIKHLTVIAGHVHNSIQVTDTLLPTYVAGEGIAHRDLIGNKPSAKVLIGDIYAGQQAYLSWELNMIPRQYHTSLKSQRILIKHLEDLASSDHELGDGETSIAN